MYTMVMVDDNPDAIRGLNTLVDWKELDIDVIGTASNGNEAMELLESTHVDILLADVRMPGMDGLVLTDVLTRSAPETRVILLSAYEVFEYARDAIRLGVEAYLIKPATIEEIEETFRSVCERIEYYRCEQDRIRALEHHSRKADIAEINNDLYRLAWADVRYDESEARKRLQHMDVLRFVEPYFAIVIDIDDELLDYAKGSPNLCDLTLQNFYQDIGDIGVAKIGHPIVKFFHSVGGKSVGIVSVDWNCDDDGDFPIPSGVKLSEGIRDFVTRQVGLSVSVGMSRIRKNVMALAQSVRDAENALEYRLYQGEGHGFYLPAFVSKNIPPSQYPLELERRIVEVVSVGSTRELEKLVDSFVDCLAGQLPYHPRASREACHGLVLRLAKFVSSRMQDTAECNRLTDLDVEEFSTQKTLPEIKLTLLETLYSISKCLAQVNPFNLEIRIEEAKQYICDHLHEKVSLSEVARHTGFSVNYFSMLFHQTVGETFRQYLLEVRMERAKCLLHTGAWKVSEVAHLVGYSDARCFSDAFKRYEGSPPHWWYKAKAAL